MFAEKNRHLKDGKPMTVNWASMIEFVNIVCDCGHPTEIERLLCS